MDLQVEEVSGSVNCVRLAGRLDAAGADQVGVRFSASGSAAGRHIVVDLSQVSFVASMGIRLLIATARAGCGAKDFHGGACFRHAASCHTRRPYRTGPCCCRRLCRGGRFRS